MIKEIYDIVSTFITDKNVNVSSFSRDGHLGYTFIKYGLADYPAKKAMEAAQRFSQSFCAKANQWIMETDRQMKTSFDDPQRLLEMLILQLSQEAKNG